MEKIVVTGGLGFIGSNFIRNILEARQNFLISNVDGLMMGSNPANVKGLEKNPRYRLVKGDLSKFSFTRRALKKATFVVHFAAQTHVDRSIPGPDPFFESNTRAAYNVFQAARENEITKLIHISTDEVYGSINSGSFTEKSPLNPSSPYSATKAAADLMAHAWSTTYNLPIVTLRCTNNYGPRQHPEKFIPKAIIRALGGMDVPLYGGGGQIRDWIYVQDFCTAIESAMEKGEPGRAYNVSAGNELTNREVAERVLKQLDSSTAKVVDVEDRPGHDFRYSLDSTATRRAFGWRPTKSFEEGLYSTINWYRSNKAWWRPLATKKILSPTPWKES